MSEPVVVDLTPAPFAYVSLRSTLAEMAHTMGDGFRSLGEKFAAAGAPMAGSPLAHYTSFDESTATFDLGFPARPEDLDALRAAGLSIGGTPAGRGMTATHVGPYETVSKTYELVTAAMKRQELTGTRDMWERYLSPPGTSSEQIRTEVIWPLVPGV